MAKKFTIYFGSNIQFDNGDSGVVTDLEFKYFLQFYVDTMLEGYSVFDGVGIWRGRSEACRKLETVAFDEQGMIEELVKEIIFCYNRAFNQECCMLTEEEVNVKFI